MSCGPSDDIGAYLAPTPRHYQSGQLDPTGPISMCEDRLTNSTSSKHCAFAKCIGINKQARIAMARKLPINPDCIWVDDTDPRWGNKHDQLTCQLQPRPKHRLCRDPAATQTPLFTLRRHALNAIIRCAIRRKHNNSSSTVATTRKVGHSNNL